MNRKQRWTMRDDKQLKTLWGQRMCDEDIAGLMGRTKDGIRNHRHQIGLVTHRKPKKKGAKYTKYMQPRRTISLLWGLIKVTYP